MQPAKSEYQSILAMWHFGHIQPHGLNVRFILLYNLIIFGRLSFGCSGLLQIWCGAVDPFRVIHK
jgi:hypothetical protein